MGCPLRAVVSRALSTQLDCSGMEEEGARCRLSAVQYAVCWYCHASSHTPIEGLAKLVTNQRTWYSKLREEVGTSCAQLNLENLSCILHPTAVSEAQ